MDRLYTVSELAQLLDLTPRAIRFYEQKGLIKPQRAGNTRVYNHRDKGRLHLILRGKRLGFSLAEIREYLDLYDTDRTQHSQLRHLLAKVRDRIAALEAQRQDLEETLGELHGIREEAEQALQDRAATGRDVSVA